MDPGPAGSEARRDLLRRPLPFLVAWGAPVMLVAAANLAPMPGWMVVLALTVALLWMGIACAINARRCRRRHCYWSAPVLVAAALLTALFGYRVLPGGAMAIQLTIWAAVAGVALGFVAEAVWGRYLRPANGGGN